MSICCHVLYLHNSSNIKLSSQNSKKIIFFIFRTVHRKYNTVKNGLSVYVKGHRPVERDPSDPSFQSIANKYQYDPAIQDQRSKQRMKMREERLKARESNGFSTSPLPSPASSARNKRHQELMRCESGMTNNKSFRYMRRQPSIVQVNMIFYGLTVGSKIQFNIVFLNYN